MKAKTRAKKVAKSRAAHKRPAVGQRIIEGLEQAVAWTRGENDRARVTLVHLPEVDVPGVRRKMTGHE